MLNNDSYFQTRKPALAAVLLILLGGMLVPVTFDYSPVILPSLLSGLFMGSGALILWRQLALEHQDKSRDNQNQNQKD
ncbi:hypothetical protein [Ferrovum sp.]|uniref:hypothetical protein n=1 Tax=Ferrovum sp. TaxID=2609467 RepID=UPI0026359342|nr:hypothetical protein [Ferrovum sp.]